METTKAHASSEVTPATLKSIIHNTLLHLAPAAFNLLAPCLLLITLWTILRRAHMNGLVKSILSLLVRSYVKSF
ncbi:hypothetical protein EB796_013338 [Bugula neritina]|uniref:Uncharacterized protein n=1 Tax=Bugula neritina TaxID=10212 RepID=A0A7J7JSD2_BUGNE|nr:hypothetical protein EB796_013338 [Bugula neritina]